MRDATFRLRRYRVYPLEPRTISIDAIILLVVFLAGYGIRALTRK